MPASSEGREFALLNKPALLLTESRKDFDALKSALEREIQPRGFVEELYVADIAALVWEIVRFRRCKVAMINTAFRVALEQILYQHMDVVEFAEAGELAATWFTNEKAKRDVAEMLSQFGLDESAIEAEAMRRLASELEVFDKMLTSLELRRERCLRGIADYRLARQLRSSSDKLLEQPDIPRLQSRSA